MNWPAVCLCPTCAEQIAVPGPDTVAIPEKPKRSTPPKLPRGRAGRDVGDEENDDPPRRRRSREDDGAWITKKEKKQGKTVLVWSLAAFRQQDWRVHAVLIASVAMYLLAFIHPIFYPGPALLGAC